MSEINVKKMASMLRSGATMLDEYCPSCSNILFRLKDQRIFCPICESEVIKNKVNNEININERKKESLSKDNSDSYSELNNKLVLIFTRYVNELQDLKEIYIIEKYLENINKILDIIKKLRELQR